MKSMVLWQSTSGKPFVVRMGSPTWWPISYLYDIYAYIRSPHSNWEASSCYNILPWPSIEVTLLAVSTDFIISISNMYVLYSCDVIAFFASNLIVKSFFCYLLYCWKADWLVGICCCIFPFILFCMHFAMIFIKRYSIIIGLRFVQAPFFLGFLCATIPPLGYWECFPVLAVHNYNHYNAQYLEAIFQLFCSHHIWHVFFLQFSYGVIDLFSGRVVEPQLGVSIIGLLSFLFKKSSRKFVIALTCSLSLVIFPLLLLGSRGFYKFIIWSILMDWFIHGESL